MMIYHCLNIVTKIILISKKNNSENNIELKSKDILMNLRYKKLDVDRTRRRNGKNEKNIWNHNSLNELVKKFNLIK